MEKLLTRPDLHNVNDNNVLQMGTQDWAWLNNTLNYPNATGKTKLAKDDFPPVVAENLKESLQAKAYSRLRHLLTNYPVHGK